MASMAEPSGKRLHNNGQIHHFYEMFNGKTHDFDWAMFNGYVKLPEGSGYDMDVIWM